MNDRKFKAATISKIIIAIMEIILFGIVLWKNYGPAVYGTDMLLGNIITLILYIIVYIALGNLFRAFKIADYSISETIFSQFLAFGIADLLLYSEFCVMGKSLFNIIPGVITVFNQLIVATIWALMAKRFMIWFVKPESTIIISGKGDVDEFLEKLRKIAHIFNVERIIELEKLPARWEKVLSAYQAVILYEVPSEKRSKLIQYCMKQGKSLYMTPQIDDIVMQGFGARHLIDTPMLKYEYRSDSFWYTLIKRAADLVVSLLILIVTSPIFLITALAIKLEDHGPVFYKQKRCTKNGRVFEIIKFRSMIVNAEAAGKSVPCRKGDPRITRTGRIIRAIRVDELPQILNVIKGDMSLVGPRPERVEHVEEYTREIPEFSYRLRVKGGLTGYAQIYGKYNTSPYDKLRLDLQYIERQSLLLDLKLLLLTIKIMFVPESTEGFSEEKSAKISNETRSASDILSKNQGE